MLRGAWQWHPLIPECHHRVSNMALWRRQKQLARVSWTAVLRAAPPKTMHRGFVLSEIEARELFELTSGVGHLKKCNDRPV